MENRFGNSPRFSISRMVLSDSGTFSSNCFRLISMRPGTCIAASESALVAIVFCRKEGLVRVICVVRLLYDSLHTKSFQCKARNLYDMHHGAPRLAARGCPVALGGGEGPRRRVVARILASRRQPSPAVASGLVVARGDPAAPSLRSCSARSASVWTIGAFSGRDPSTVDRCAALKREGVPLHMKATFSWQRDSVLRCLHRHTL